MLKHNDICFGVNFFGISFQNWWAKCARPPRRGTPKKPSWCFWTAISLTQVFAFSLNWNLMSLTINHLPTVSKPVKARSRSQKSLLWTHTWLITVLKTFVFVVCYQRLEWRWHQVCQGVRRGWLFQGQVRAAERKREAWVWRGYWIVQVSGAFENRKIPEWWSSNEGLLLSCEFECLSSKERFCEVCWDSPQIVWETLDSLANPCILDYDRAKKGKFPLPAL